ncbi:BRCA1-associated -like [Olea europaea subsp. europaea]|uniref:BRCA1-associated -like n=1 Tax=Olea europaea subsp. europaea TaxID=158383 RepID=A0A8S0T7V2_OLEEU|nr:BRCA1-associated -like [Olea europaea subsp. europaea]
MSTLKIHTVDFPQPLITTVTSSAAEQHLVRSRARTTLLFVAAVPNYFSPNDFLLFRLSYLPNFIEIHFIRERLSLKSEEEKVADPQEQIRDLKIYVEAQRMVANMKDSDSIKGGTVLPVESDQSSSSNRK